MAEVLRNHFDMATGQWALASIYRCFHDVTVNLVNMNINRPIWRVQMWLQRYVLELRVPGIKFRDDMVPAQTLIKSALFEPTTANYLVVFRHTTERTESSGCPMSKVGIPSSWTS